MKNIRMAVHLFNRDFPAPGSMLKYKGKCISIMSYYDAASAKITQFREKYGDLHIAVGECLNADSFELALALTEYGFHVPEIYGTVGERNFVFIRRLAAVSPDTASTPSTAIFTRFICSLTAATRERRARRFSRSASRSSRES